MSSIRQCVNIKDALLKYNNMIVRSKIKVTKKYLKCHFKMIISQPSICCIVRPLLFSKSDFNLTLLYFSRQFVPVAYVGIKKGNLPRTPHSWNDTCHVAGSCRVSMVYHLDICF